MYTSPRPLTDDEAKVFVHSILAYAKNTFSIELELNLIQDLAVKLAQDKIEEELKSRMESLSVEGLMRVAEACTSVDLKIAEEIPNGKAKKKRKTKKKKDLQ